MSSATTPEINLDKNHFVKQMLVKMFQPVVQTNKVVYIYNKKYLLLLVIAEIKALQFLFTFWGDGCGGDFITHLNHFIKSCVFTGTGWVLLRVCLCLTVIACVCVCVCLFLHDRPARMMRGT